MQHAPSTTARFAVAAIATIGALAGCRDNSPPVPAALFAVTQPASAARSGVLLTQQPIIQLRDASGRDVGQRDVPVTVTIASGGGGSTLAGTTTVNTTEGGKAEFTDLAISGIVGAKVLSFTAPNLTAANSDPIALAAGPASHLAIATAPPANAQSGVPLATAPVVQLRDAAGNDAPESGVAVVASITAGGGTVSGGTASTDADGRAVFDALAISGIVGTRTLSFTATGMSVVITDPIALAEGPPAQLAVITQPSAEAFVDEPFAQQPVVQLRDDAGNDVAQSGVSVTAGIQSGSGTLAGTTSVPTNAAGRAVFTDLEVHGSADARRLSFSAAGLSPTSSAMISAAISGCSLESLPDADGDRLPDCVEGGGGVFVSTLITGTSPTNPDTDGDGLRDGDEVLGTVAGLRLPQMGVHPLRKNILIEFDWFDDALECGSHSHRPTPAMVQLVVDAFAAAPVENPDGTSGITVIGDYGQGGEFTEGNRIQDDDGLLVGGVFNAEYIQHKAANFDPMRDGYFYYVMLPHRYGNSTNGSSGQAAISGDVMIVSLYCARSETNVANTIMHELGHNLGLLHGGFESLNYKPNYNSVMNYRYQFPGVDNDCTPPGNGVLDYSRGGRPDLDENTIDERQGICGSPPGPGWDWNGNGTTGDFGFPMDINGTSPATFDGFLSILQDSNDWAQVHFFGLQSGFYTTTPVVSCMNVPPPR